jgi:hypothetical protein
MTNLSVGLGATKAPWSGAFRSYVRDHGQGITLRVVMDRGELERAAPGFDVLVLDDVMRTFSISDVARAQDRGAHVVGIFDPGPGMGRQYLAGLGVDEVLPATTAPSELAAHFLQLKPRTEPTTAVLGRPNFAAATTPGRRGARRGKLNAWTKVSGGSGLTEAVVAAAELVSRRARVLLIEAEELSPVLVSRLLRSPETGLPWAVARAGQGLRALPEGLSGPRDDGPAPVGHFDVICASPGAPQALNAAHLGRLVAEALGLYDEVFIETGWLMAPSSGRERFGAVRDVLVGADRVVVMASADPEGAARLVEWKAAAETAGVSGPSVGVFGRARDSAYERDHLARVVLANTGRKPFTSLSFLPEDQTVARARWNAEMVWRCPWLKAVTELVAASNAASAVAARGDGPQGRYAAPLAYAGSTSLGAVAV